jgi:hypothetical protein
MGELGRYGVHHPSIASLARQGTKAKHTWLGVSRLAYVSYFLGPRDRRGLKPGHIVNNLRLAMIEAIT